MRLGERSVHGILLQERLVHIMSLLTCVALPGLLGLALEVPTPQHTSFFTFQ